MAVLEIRALGVRYGDVDALRDVDLDIEAGTTLAVIGPNGSGKSTLLKAVAGVVRPSTGTVQVDGDRPSFVLQTTEVDRSLPISVRDAVAMARYPGLGPFRRFRPEDHAALDHAMARLDIADLASRQLHDLSGGQRQRVLVAQGLAQDAPLLLLDEPVTGLDVVSRSTILDVVDEECAAGRAVIMTTHDLDDARRFDRVLLLARRPVALGPPDEVLTEDHLREAFGGRFQRVGDALVVEYPHHH